MEQSLGNHMLAEYYGCNTSLLNDMDLLKQIMISAADIAGATIVDTSFHAYSPVGISGIVVVKESHFAIHTWPEYGYAAIDLFTCSLKMNYHKAFYFLKEKLQANYTDYQIIRRGKLSLINNDVIALKSNHGYKGSV